MRFPAKLREMCLGLDDFKGESDVYGRVGRFER